MGLPARQQRVLEQIEHALQAADPRLKSMFATFTRFTGQAQAPENEAIGARWHRPSPAALISIIVIGLVTLGLIIVPAVIRACPGLPSDQAVASATVRYQNCSHATNAWSRGGR
jgi:Protein of unknown function (DUF3040)